MFGEHSVHTLLFVTVLRVSAMTIIPQYLTKALPKDHVSLETHCKMVQEYLLDDETGKPIRDENGQRVKKGPARMVRDDNVESRGGIMFTFPSGASIRLATQNQLDLFGLTTEPKLIDTATGEEVDERGVPKSLAQYVADTTAPKGDFGLVDASEE